MVVTDLATRVVPVAGGSLPFALSSSDLQFFLVLVARAERALAGRACIMWLLLISDSDGHRLPPLQVLEPVQVEVEL
jgi:hypothetical protein